MPNQARVLARLDDFPDGSMRQVERDGVKILLVRRGDEVFAVEGTCPHAGGPLAEGVLVGDRVVCPWHKAEFCVTTGSCTQPPAVDDLKRFPVGLRDGDVLVSPEPAIGPEPGLPTDRDPRRFVIVGGGAAGAVAAQTLRAEGFAGMIVMIDPEGELPYDRTLLSKYMLSGAEAGEKSPLQDAAFYQRHAIERRRGRVQLLDPARKIIRLEDGTDLTYDAALVATGGRPIRPDFPGHELQNVFLLRSKADAQHLLAAAIPGHRAIVLGASFIGMEVAASLRERGLAVTVVADQRAPFEQQLGAGAVLEIDELAADKLEGRILQLRQVEGERQLALEPRFYRMPVGGNDVDRICAGQSGNVEVEGLRERLALRSVAKEHGGRAHNEQQCGHRCR